MAMILTKLTSKHQMPRLSIAMSEDALCGVLYHPHEHTAPLSIHQQPLPLNVPIANSATVWLDPLQRLLEHMPAPGNGMTLVLHPKQYLLRRIKLPQHPNHSEALPQQLAPFLPYALNTCFWDAVLLRKELTTTEWLLAACQRSMIEPLLMALDRLRLQVDILELACFALTRFGYKHYLDRARADWSLWIDTTSLTWQVHLFDQHGWQNSVVLPTEHGAAITEDHKIAALQSLLHQHKPPHATLDIILIGQARNLHSLQSSLSERLQSACSIIDPETHSLPATTRFAANAAHKNLWIYALGGALHQGPLFHPT